MESKKKKILFLLSHPIQYFSPLFQSMAKESEFDLMVLYCDDYGTHKRNVHPEIGEIAGWDIPLLEGYTHKFLKNNSWKPSIFKGFLGLINFEIFKVIKKNEGSLLVIHGWNYATHLIAIVYGKLKGLTICIRGDNPYNQEILKNKRRVFIKKILLGKLLFKFIDYFLYVGKQNKEFYKFYGVPESKFVFTPHAVDNERFKAEFEKYSDKRLELLKELCLPIDKIIVLTIGKYSQVKNHLNLLRAFRLLDNPDVALVIVGEGELRREIEEYIQINLLKNVFLTGFKNQTEICKYYAVADIFVLPSKSETWGLVVNEAMNFGLPIIVSDMVGCRNDLLIENENGFIFQLGNIEQLRIKLDLLLNDEAIRKNFSTKSQEIISNYSYTNIIKNITNALLENN